MYELDDDYHIPEVVNKVGWFILGVMVFVGYRVILLPGEIKKRWFT